MGIERAIIPVYGEDGCVEGWALQVVGDLGIPENLSAETLALSDSFIQSSEDGGFMTLSIPAIEAVPIVIIPDSPSDVKHVMRGELVISNGTASTFLGFTLTQGGIVTQNMTAGSETIQVKLNANGSVEVVRTAGTLPVKASVRIMWL